MPISFELKLRVKNGLYFKLLCFEMSLLAERQIGFAFLSPESRMSSIISWHFDVNGFFIERGQKLSKKGVIAI